MTNTIKWTKGDFEITTGYMGEERKEVRAGYVSGNFGIHKEPNGFHQWPVTHIPSGLSIHLLSGGSLKQTKLNVAAVSAVDWSGQNIHVIAEANEMSTTELLDYIRVSVESAA